MAGKSSKDEMQKSRFPAVTAAVNSKHKHKDESIYARNVSVYRKVIQTLCFMKPLERGLKKTN